MLYNCSPFHIMPIDRYSDWLYVETEKEALQD